MVASYILVERLCTDCEAASHQHLHGKRKLNTASTVERAVKKQKQQDAKAPSAAAGAVAETAGAAAEAAAYTRHSGRAQLEAAIKNTTIYRIFPGLEKHRKAPGKPWKTLLEKACFFQVVSVVFQRRIYRIPGVAPSRKQAFPRAGK